MKSRSIFLFLCCVLLPSCQKANPIDSTGTIAAIDESNSSVETISFLSLTDSGEVIAKKINKDEYENHLNHLIESAQESTLPSLKKASKNGKWALSTVIIGFGIKLDFSIGFLANVGFNPGIRFAFSNSKKPNVP
jgi:hypothetical protein